MLDKANGGVYRFRVIQLSAMNTKFLKAVAAIAVAVVATSPLVRAAAVSPSDFKTELAAKIGTKKGTSASNAAANYFGKVLGDKANKKNADKYAKEVIKQLKKAVPLSSSALAGNAINANVKKLISGYFKGVSKPNINDSLYNKALASLLKGLPSGAKTEPTSQALYNSVVAGFKKSNSLSTINTYFGTKVVPKIGNIPPKYTS